MYSERIFNDVLQQLFDDCQEAGVRYLACNFPPKDPDTWRKPGQWMKDLCWSHLRWNLKELIFFRNLGMFVADARKEDELAFQTSEEAEWVQRVEEANDELAQEMDDWVASQREWCAENGKDYEAEHRQWCKEDGLDYDVESERNPRPVLRACDAVLVRVSLEEHHRSLAEHIEVG